MFDLTILDCGTTLVDVYKKFGHATDWIQNVLSDCKIDFKIHQVYKHDIPELKPNSGYIITGSADAVYDCKVWMKELEIFIKACADKNCFILGICFGHQIIASAFGGKVIKNPLGWELGSNALNLTSDGLHSDLFKDCERELLVYESHQDVVSVLPENAISLAYNKMGNQSFSMYNRIFGVQFHPEFNREISQKYLDVRLELGADYSSRKVEDSNKSNKIINNFFQLYKEAIYK